MLFPVFGPVPVSSRRVGCATQSHKRSSAIYVDGQSNMSYNLHTVVTSSKTAFDAHERAEVWLRMYSEMCHARMQAGHR